MQASVKRAIFIGILLLALASGLAVAFWPRAVPVDLATIDTGDIIVTVDADGRTDVRNVHVISAPLAGRLSRISMRPGDPVTARETILATIEEMDPAMLDARSRAEREAHLRAAEAAVALGQAEVEQARAHLDFARVTLRRTMDLHGRGATTGRALDEARLEVATGEARVQTAEANLQIRESELESARAALIEPGENAQRSGPRCCVPVRAPVNGEVLRVLERNETIVQAGTPLIEIGDPRDLEILVDVPSSEAVRISTGDRAIIENWGGPSSLTGTVQRVEPSAFTKVSALGIEEQRVNVVITLEDLPEQRDRLGHGYRVLVRVVVNEARDVPQVPTGALFRDGDRWAVFVEDGGRAALRHVETGSSDGRHAAVREGLTTGDRVVLHPSDRIADGIRITTRD